MAANIREYRDRLHRGRMHSELPNPFVDSRNSNARLYLSLLPFLVGEYIAERSFSNIPSALVFPTSYLLFWAFYYTYYKPNVLENHLASNEKWDLLGIPATFLGFFIWFVKVSVVELTHLFLRAVFGVKKPEEKKKAPRTESSYSTGSYHSYHSKTSTNTGSYSQRPGTSSGSTGSAGPRAGAESRQKEAPFAKPAAPSTPRSGLPRDLVQALATLGLTENSDWKAIHRKYRELAKSLHPDLNGEITQVGRRFMNVDAAYRKLNAAKAQYFPN